MFKLSRKTIIVVSSIILVSIILTTTLVVLLQNSERYDLHGPIIILKDKDFKYYGFPGKGTPDSPYLIQNYNITTNHTECIYISGTTKHFIIQNCYLVSNTQYSDTRDTTSIFIENVVDNSVQIIGNEMHGAIQGIKMVNSQGPVIENNNISIVPFGITGGPFFSLIYSFNTELINCGNSIINNNTLTKGKFKLLASHNSSIRNNEIECSLDIEGEDMVISANRFLTTDFKINYSPNLVITENTFTGTSLDIVSSHHAIISENIFTVDLNIESSSNASVLENIFNQGAGLSVDGSYAKVIGNLCPDGGSINVDSQYSIISNNQILNGGYRIYDASSTVENNLINNKQLGFFANIEDQIYSSNTYGQYIFVECKNIMVKDLEISNTSAGVFIKSSNNITVKNSKFTFACTDASDSSNIYILNNTFDDWSPVASRCNNVNVIDNIIEGCTIVGECSFSNIVNNTISSPGMGVYLWRSNFSVVRNNNFPFGYIRSFYSYHGIIVNNTIVSDCYGIEINNEFGSYANNTIDNNNITTSLYVYGGSIYIEYGYNLTISNNVMNNGIKIWALHGYELNHLRTLKIANNTNNGKSIGFYVDKEDLVLSSEFSQLFLFNCSNVEVSNQIMNESNEGMTFFYCNNIALENNYINNTQAEVLIIRSSSNLVIKNNTIDNTIFGDGIVIGDCENCTISENIFSNGHWCTLRIGGSYNCLIMNNSFLRSSSHWGLILNGAINCTIKYNLFMLNPEGGLVLDEYTKNITVHHNAFIDNNLEGYSGTYAQAWDKGENNIWYDQLLLEGNFWSNWSGVGSYGIGGGNSDPYPLLSNPL